MPKDWLIPPPHPERERLAMALRVAPVVAQVLLNRGIGDETAARQFLKPQASDLYPPEMLPGACEAAERIVAAAKNGEKIVLFGDYDVDGITGVSILWHCLRLAGADPAFYIPHRLEEGYGISAEAIETLAHDGAQLIVTVDCGVTAIEPARVAKARGVDLIITDHHAPHVDASGRAELPEALIVHPVYPREGPEGGVARLECNDPAFLQTWFPEKFRSWFYGRNLNLSDARLPGYFEEAARFHAQLEDLFPPGLGIATRVGELLARLDGGRPFVSAPGPMPGTQYMFTTVRAHAESGYLPAHFDNEQRLRPSYRHLRTLVELNMMSFVLVLAEPQAGGALEVNTKTPSEVLGSASTVASGS